LEIWPDWNRMWNGCGGDGIISWICECIWLVWTLLSETPSLFKSHLKQKRVVPNYNTVHIVNTLQELFPATSRRHSYWQWSLFKMYTISHLITFWS
jgi:hypothetical protein